MIKKVLISLLISLLVICAAVFYIFPKEEILRFFSTEKNLTKKLSPIATRKSEFEAESDSFDAILQNEKIQHNYETNLADNNTLNIVLLGIDRRAREELGYRTDIMILVSINKTTNKVVLTSIPRDLWYDTGRLNALYVNGGWSSLQEAFTAITGNTPQRYILTDFKDFSWLVDALGGVPVNVETTFTDTQYPIDETKEYQTIQFTQGPERLTGERALIYARSRKGDYDNGDWGRMKRQHNILKGMLETVSHPESIVCKNTDRTIDKGSCEGNVNSEALRKVFNILTTGKMDTNLEVKDLTYLWDLFKDRDKYKIESILMDYTYLYTPPAAEYGGAWVLAPKGDSFELFQKDLKNTLLNIPIPKKVPPEYGITKEDLDGDGILDVQDVGGVEDANDDTEVDNSPGEEDPR